MPCNTAHHYAPAVRSAVSIPLIDMVQLSVAHAASLAGQGGRVGILASPAVRQVGLFDGPCAASGLVAVYPDGRGRDAGRHPQPQGRRSERRSPSSRWLPPLPNFWPKVLQVQMIACTEFSLIADATAPESRSFDTLDQLVKGIIAFASQSEEA
jgi:aspartate racemase